MTTSVAVVGVSLNPKLRAGVKVAMVSVAAVGLTARSKRTTWVVVARAAGEGETLMFWDAVTVDVAPLRVKVATVG